MKSGLGPFSNSRDFLMSQRINFNKECFLYSFSFKEDCYLVACKYASCAPKIGKVLQACSIISSKRMIDRMRHQNYYEIVYSESDSNPSRSWGFGPYFHVLSEMICFVLEIYLSSCTAPPTMKKLIVDWKPSRSIHSIFLFLEDRLPKSNNIISIRIPQKVHSESLIRLFRRSIQDAPFLHLLRLALHKYKKISVNSVYLSRNKGRKNIASVPWNFYISEIDSTILFLKNQVHGSQSRPFRSIDWNSITRKGGRTSWYEYRSYGANMRFCLSRFFFHYGRYRNHSILAIGGTKYFARKWIYFLSILLESYSDSCVKYNRVFFERLSKDSFLFLGYNLGFRSIVRRVRVSNAGGEPYFSLFVTNQVFTELPITLMVKLMARKNSCDSAGHPISKSAWVTLPDDDILKRFGHIWRILSVFYGGSTNRDGSRRSRYILRLSCDKTLACKHKSTTRSLQRRFDSETFLDNSVKYNEMTSNLSNAPRSWCMNVIRPAVSTLATSEIQN